VPTGMTLGSASARIHLTRDSVVVDSLVARTPSTGGRLRFAGTLDRTDPTIPVVNATFVGTSVRVLESRERGRVDVDGNLTIAGPLATPYVYGAASVRDGIYYIAPSSGKNLIDLRGPIISRVVDTANPVVRGLLPSSTSLLSNLLMDVDLTVNRSTWVRNENGNVEIYSDGPLTLHIDHADQALVVNGTINTEVGEYTFLGKHFAITKGSATFIGTPKINPTLQATGGYSVPVPGREALVINIDITGTLDSLRLALSTDAEPPVSQSDLLSYLAFSHPTSGVAGSSQTSSLAGGGTGGVVGTASTFVENQLAAEAVGVVADQLKGNLARALNADVLNITTGNNYTDVAQNKGNSAATFFQNTQLEFGKYFTPKTYVALQASAAPGGRVIHRVGQGLSLQLSGEPLYLLGQPTLATNPNTPLTGVLGLTLVKSWRF
jgi:autotransporter translocation and assembly factor TamB